MNFFVKSIKELQKLVFIMEFLSNILQENEDTPFSELNELKNDFRNGQPSLENISKLSKICHAAKWMDYVNETIAGQESLTLKDVIVFVVKDNIEDLKDGDHYQ
jgi:hypothetical protein